MSTGRIFIGIGLVLLLVVCGWAGWLFLRDKPPVLRVEIPEELVNLSEPSKFDVQPVDLKRNKFGDQLQVFFPAVKRETRVSVYTEQNYRRLMQETGQVSPLYLTDAEQLRAVHGRPVLNFSNLPDGSYYVHLSSCNYGGYFCFRLVTVKK
ncbi:MAG: hypothetical protein MUC87_11190 [Bacteroidia bacterium]|jgi:hypothetical protein|nr:hypothetical protein [Bacteroidia bacterium]